MAELPNPRDADRDGRNETEAQRADRNLAELLQELRVAALGVQVLFGFLLALPFAVGFTKLSTGQRHLYVATLVLAAMATALLTGPVAYHRLVFRRHEKTRLVSASNAMALGGLGAVGLAVSAAVWLVVSFVCHGWTVPLISAAVFAFFCVFWIVVPALGRRLPQG
ncbi:MAG: hypothetical protein JWO62_1853 [Acidimicrobiaceae bacterium]|jgi:hypothetical protein|nr:hypothetical protein [Acidimicrobiaceae bacterium]